MDIESRLLSQRVSEIKPRLLSFELEYMPADYKASMLKALDAGRKIQNLNNSALIYALGLSDNYDPNRRIDYDVIGSGPDIDTDFSKIRRDELLKAIIEKYGKDNVARICTYKPWSLKDSVVAFKKRVPNKLSDGSIELDENGEPVYGTHQDGHLIASRIPDAFRGRRLSSLEMAQDPFFKPLIKEEPEVFSYSAHMDGQPNSVSIHACGIIISPEPLSDKVPLRKVADEEENWTLITQWEGPDLEKLGYTKYDILVLDNLDINNMTCELLGKPYSWLEEQPLDDIAAFNIINQGYSAGLFQIEEDHVTKVINQIKPSTVEDIAAISALIRPGPKDSGLTDDYIEYRKTGLSQNKLHPLLDPSLKETGGVLVYQEQVMLACQILAGVDLTTADQIRRAMGKKDFELMAFYKKIFSDGAYKTHRILESEADRIWGYIEKFADYGFNKSHAYAYALITYMNAYLKAHHPKEFMLSLLSLRSDKPEKFVRYIAEARSMGIEVEPPSINDSKVGFGLSKTGIVFGMNAIKGIGESVTASILEVRQTPFLNIWDFFNRINRSTVNTKSVDILTRVGAFDSFGYDRELLIEKLPEIHKYYDDLAAFEDWSMRNDERIIEIAQWEIEIKQWEEDLKSGLIQKFKIDNKTTYDKPKPKKPVSLRPRELPVKPDISNLIREKKRITLSMLQSELELCGYFISAHPLDFVKPPSHVEWNRIEDITEHSCRKGYLLAAVTGIEEKKVKSGKSRGKSMAFVKLQDQTGYSDVFLFPNQYERLLGAGFTLGSVIYMQYQLESISGAIRKLKMAGDNARVIGVK